MPINFDMVDELGRTPLFWAVWRNNLVIVKALLKKGANPNHLDNYNKNVLSALHFGWPHINVNTILILEVLLKHNTNIGDAITYAGLDGNIEAVKMLIKYGANPKDAAKHSDNPEILKLAGYSESQETKEFIKVINDSSYYCFATKKFDDNDEKNKEMGNIAKNTKINKKVTLYGYHGGCAELKSPVSVMDVLKVSHKFVEKGLDHYRSIDKAKYKKETEDTVVIEIAVDNFST